jgi:hypothetical protein
MCLVLLLLLLLLLRVSASLQVREKHDLSNLTTLTYAHPIAAAAAAAALRTFLHPCRPGTSTASATSPPTAAAAAAESMQVWEKHNLSDFTTRAPALVKQLRGLTLVCSAPSEQYDEWAAPYRPVPLLTALQGLTSECLL